MKKSITRILLVLVGLIVVAGAAFLLGRLTSTHSNAEAPRVANVADEGNDTDHQGDREVLFWRAPMDPNEVYDHPGKSKMGMDLVPVYADEADAAAQGIVQIDAVTMQNVGVRTAPVTIETLARTVRTTGLFAADERAHTAVSLKVGGWVEKLFVDYDGARVEQGQPLLALYSPELVSTQEEYLLAYRNAAAVANGPAAADAQRLLDAARRRLAYWDISDEQIEHLQETGTPERTLKLYAPSGGTVVSKNVYEGQRVMPGQTLMEIADLSHVWLMVDVYEQELSWVGVGTKAEVSLSYDPGVKTTGRVEYIYDTLDPATRSVKARLSLPNPGLRFKPGMYATVILKSHTAAPTPVVPEEALVRSGSRSVAIVALGNGRFRPVEVVEGASADGKVQILDGLEGGEQIVTSAQFLIDSEARLQSAVTAMTEEKKAAADSTGAQQMQGMEGMDSGEAIADAAAPPKAHMKGNTQVVEIEIGPSGYEPADVQLTAGIPARLVFKRTTDATCAKQIMIPDFGIDKTDMPLNEPVALEFTPTDTGTFNFACGMNMLKGTLLVQSGT